MFVTRFNLNHGLQICLLLLTVVTAIVLAISEVGPTVITFDVEEESGLRHVVGLLHEHTELKKIFSDNERVGHKLTYELLQSNGYFRLDRNTGQITIASIIDRESLCSNNVRTCCVRPDTSDQCTIEFAVQVVDLSVSNSLSGTHLFRIVVHILDRNDNSPRFAHSEYQFSIAEDASVGQLQSLPAAKDLDSKQFDVLRYNMASCSLAKPIDETFELQQQTTNGKANVALRLMRPLDRESQSSYIYCIVAVDKGIPSNSGTLTVRVEVADRNDHTPNWIESQQFIVQVSEATRPFTTILQLRAQDKDSSFGVLRYSIDSRDTDQENANHFIMNSESGELQIQRFLDYETRHRFLVPVLVEDNGQRSSTATVTVNVLDENDEKPTIVFTPNFQVRLQENKEPPQKLALITVQDKDSGINGQVTCKLQDQLRQDDEKFILQHKYSFEQKNYYDLFTNHTFDREYKNRYQLFISCQDGGTPSNIGKQDFTIIIEDVNDHNPTFASSFIDVAFYEENLPGERIADIQASDQDADLNGNLEYFLEESARSYVSIQKNTGRISSLIRFDREKQNLYVFNVTVRDRGTPPKSASITVNLNILDVNDNAPTFTKSSYEFVVTENSLVGTLIGQLSASDPDQGSNATILFRIKPANYLHQRQLPFSVNKTGHITLTKPVDHEVQEQYMLLAEAIDQGQPSRSSQVTLTIMVSDVNDSPPRFKHSGRAKFNVSCDNTALNYILASEDLQAEDKDTNPLYNRIQYNISYVYPRLGRDPDGRSRHAFKIDPISGQLFLTTVPENPVCVRADYVITVVAYDPTKPSLQNRKHVEVTFLAGQRSIIASRDSLHKIERKLASGDNENENSRKGFNGYNEEASNDGERVSGSRDHTLLIIVSLICISILVPVVLIVTCFLLRRRGGVNEHFRKGSTALQEPRDTQSASGVTLPSSLKLFHNLSITQNNSDKSHTQSTTTTGEQVMYSAEGVLLKPSSTSLDNIYFEHDINKEQYEKMKWSTYHHEKKQQRSQSNDRILSDNDKSENNCTALTMGRQNYGNSYNTYQSLNSMPYNNRKISHSGDVGAEYYVVCQSDNESRTNSTLVNCGSDTVSTEVWLNTAVQPCVAKSNVDVLPLHTSNQSRGGRAIDTKRTVDDDADGSPAHMKSSYFTVSFV